MFIPLSLCLAVSAYLWCFREEQDVSSLFAKCPGHTISLFMCLVWLLFAGICLSDWISPVWNRSSWKRLLRGSAEWASDPVPTLNFFMYGLWTHYRQHLDSGGAVDHGELWDTLDTQQVWVKCWHFSDVGYSCLLPCGAWICTSVWVMDIGADTYSSVCYRVCTLKLCSALRVIQLLSSFPMQFISILHFNPIKSLPLCFAAHVQIIIYYVLNDLKQDKMSWRGKPISLYQLPLRSILIFHLIPFHHDHPLLSIIKVASSISSFYPMGVQWHHVRLRFFNEWLLLTTPHLHSSTLLLFVLDRLATAASTKEEAERLLGKERQQGKILR